MPAIDHELLRRRRDELDLSNGDLAAKAGVDPKYLSNIVCGYNAPSMRIVHRLARALELKADVLAKPTGDPSDPPQQPKNEPKGPPKRQDTEPTRGPRRARDAA